MRTDVLIAGGGLAGLACAVALSDAGFAVTLVEASEALGGRARSWPDPVTGDEVDVGPHVITTHHRNFLDLLGRLGTRDDVVWQRRPLITLFDGLRSIDARLAPLPAPLSLAPVLFQASHLPLRARLSGSAALREAMRLTEADVLALDRIDGESHLRALGIAPSFIDWFWRSMCMTVLNVPLERVSAGALMRCFAQLAGHSGYCFGFPARALGALFVPAARTVIEAAGGRVVGGTAVSRLRIRDGRCVGVSLRDGTGLDARQVVSALPPAETARLLGDIVPSPPFARLEPSRYVSLYLWFEEKLTSRRFWTRTWSPTTINYDFYDLSNIRPALSGRGSLIASNVIHAQRLPPMDDAALIDATLRELAQFAPKAAGRRPFHARVHRIPLVVSCPLPGVEAARPDTGAIGLPGLYLSGAWTRTALPESMESAVRSGRLAADAICRDAGLPFRSALDPPATTGIAGLVRRWHEKARR